MAAKKTAKKTKTPATPKKERTPFYNSPSRLFTASKNKALPRGTAVSTLGADLSAIRVRAGTDKACVFDGTLDELLGAALSAHGLKVKAVSVSAPPTPAA
jgi:hypothetical protein